MDLSQAQAMAATPPAIAGSKTVVFPLGNKPFSTPFHSVGLEICQNMYLETAQSENAKALYYLVKTPGLRRLGNLITSNIGACRGMFTSTNGRSYMVNGNTFSEILSDGSRVVRGTLNSYTGAVSMAENGLLLMLVDGTNGWILRYSDSNFTKITDEYFPGIEDGTLAPTHVTYLDTYFIVNIPNTNEYYWSTSYYGRDHDDTTTAYDPAEPNGYWTPLQSGKKIGKPDNIVAVINCNNYLWIPGTNSMEVHYDTGNFNGQLFARYQGAIINIGCSAPNSVAVYANNIFFLGTDKDGTLGVFSNTGFEPTRVSPRGIEQIIELMPNYNDCQAFTYAQAGHAYYVMQFPSANRTFVYDLLTQSWHERTHLVQETGLLARWDGMYITENFGRLLVGDAYSNALYTLDPLYYQNDNATTDGVNYIRCVKTLPIAFQLGANVRYNWYQLVCSQGMGLSVNTPAGVGQNPTVQLAWSDDSGYTYGNERSAPLGRQGEYGKRTRYLGCGMGRNRVLKVAYTDPTPFILVMALVNASPCRH